MKMPNPKATTTTEAYLAYKAGVIAEDELKPKLYHPYIHLDGWLAYWCGLVDTYPTDKNGDPECLTDEEAYIAYLANVTNAYPLNLKDPADPRVAGYLRYLIAAKFGRPNYPVTREEFYLSIMKPPVVGNLTPASSIELDGVITSPLISLETYGDTSQATYTGKNKLNPFLGYPAGTNFTSFGVTYTLNGDGTFTVNGTSTGDSYWNFNNSVLVDGTGMKLVIEMVDGYLDDPNELFLRAYSDGTGANYRSARLAHDIRVASSTEMAATDYAIIRLAVGNGKKINNVRVRVMMVPVDATTDYEPYVGGVASPNPSYPQEVNTVTGRQSVRISQNAINMGEITGTRPNGVQVEYNVDTINLNGTTVKSENITENGYDWMQIATISAGEYTLTLEHISGSITIPSGKAEMCYIRVRPVGGSSYTTPAQTTLNFSGKKTFTFEVSEDVDVNIQIFANGAGIEYDDYVLNMCLEKTSQSGECMSGYYELNFGKNLLKLSEVQSGVSENGVSYTITDSKIILDGTTTSDGAVIETTMLGVELYAGNYMYSIRKVGGSFTVPVVGQDDAALYISDEDRNRLAENSMYGVNSGGYRETQITISSSKKLSILLYANRAGIKFDNFELELQLEKGTEATSYAPYFEPIELCKIGDFQDYIYRDLAGNWKIHKEIYKYVMTGEENLVLFNSGKNARMGCSDADPTGGVYNNIPVAYSMEDGSICPVRCNMLQPTTSGGGWNGTPNSISLGTVGSPAYGCITFAIPNVSSVATYLYRLMGAEIYYALKEATDEELTNEELIAQLDALMEGGSYDGTTYITVSSEDLPALLKVEAAKDV